ncbi:MAG: hypothetical protein QG662_125 [Pseudomonadota bacterium]|nr:hypothetical protein [Pseudomonadota bacterium]
MKSHFTKTTLGVIALSTLFFATAGAQASHGPEDRSAYPYQDRSWDNASPGHVPPHALLESRRLARIIDARQASQEERSVDSMRNHRLGRGEFRSLMRELKEVRAMERRFLADGLMTQAEFQKLDRALDASGHRIRLAMRDRPAHYAYDTPWRY